MAKCWIFGDESGELGRDRFFAIGILGTRDITKVLAQIKSIRSATHFFGEISYKFSDDRRALCCIRIVDWLFSKQNILKFRILIKDDNFHVDYFRNNKYGTGDKPLAYSESYKEVLCNFADFSNDLKIFTYSQINLEKFSVADYLIGKVPNLQKENCFSGSTSQRKPHSNEYTSTSELLQVVDLITSSVRGLLNSFYNEGVNKSWVKKTLQLNLLYHLPNLEYYLKNKKNFYYPSFTPYSDQKFVIYYWRGQNMPKHL